MLRETPSRIQLDIQFATYAESLIINSNGKLRCKGWRTTVIAEASRLKRQGDRNSLNRALFHYATERGLENSILRGLFKLTDKPERRHPRGA